MDEHYLNTAPWAQLKQSLVQLGTASADYPHGMNVDDSGNVFLTGKIGGILSDNFQKTVPDKRTFLPWISTAHSLKCWRFNTTQTLRLQGEIVFYRDASATIRSIVTIIGNYSYTIHKAAAHIHEHNHFIVFINATSLCFNNNTEMDSCCYFRRILNTTGVTMTLN